MDLADYLDHAGPRRAAAAGRQGGAVGRPRRADDPPVLRDDDLPARAGAAGLARRPQRGPDDVPSQPLPAQRHHDRRGDRHDQRAAARGTRSAGCSSTPSTRCSSATVENVNAQLRRRQELRGHALLPPGRGGRRRSRRKQMRAFDLVRLQPDDAVRPPRHHRDAVPLPLPRQRAGAVGGEPRLRARRTSPSTTPTTSRSALTPAWRAWADALDALLPEPRQPTRRRPDPRLAGPALRDGHPPVDRRARHPQQRRLGLRDVLVRRAGRRRPRTASRWTSCGPWTSSRPCS